MLGRALEYWFWEGEVLDEDRPEVSDRTCRPNLESIATPGSSSRYVEPPALKSLESPKPPLPRGPKRRSVLTPEGCGCSRA